MRSADAGATPITAADLQRAANPVAVAAQPGALLGQAASARQGTRTVVLGQQPFDDLRRVQVSVSTPRLDLRYILEGAITLLDLAPCVRLPWVVASRQVLGQHVRGTTLDDGFRSGAGMASPGDAEGVARVAAQTHGEPQPTSVRHADARSLRIGEACFVQLKAIQATTHDPRLEMRFLIDGAVALLMSRADLHGDWLWQSRQALLVHLLALQHQPIPSQVCFQRR